MNTNINKKSVNIQDEINAFNKDLEDSKPLHEVEYLSLRNQKERLEIEIKLQEIKSFKQRWMTLAIGIVTGIMHLM